MIRKMYPLFVIGLLLIGSPYAYPHGEDKLGPNKGYVRMPGAFHTELVNGTKGRFKVFLLDVRFKNPIIKNSFVKGIVKISGKSSPFECNPRKNHFFCDLKVAAKEPYTVEITSSRDGMVGGIAVYEFPLKLMNAHGDH